MKDKLFENVFANYEQIANDCNQFVILFTDKSMLNTIPFNELNAKLEQAKILQSKADLILTTELYHLLGMGNLNAAQTSKICKVVRSISFSRSYLKPFISYSLPTFPTTMGKSTYNCKIAKINLVASR